ncbi:hypothetical protein RUM43_011835 [Polyplax serrata]|uniref:Galactosylgalactosylxylosylprotein 3-beta-glucuronosyltransferase n=1 Tax=Polyplax serrata TaxID=468196 RepID=A0AAN8PJ06_POLSC
MDVTCHYTCSDGDNYCIRSTKKVSMFPVGLCTKFGVSSPIVKNGSFAGFYDGWMGGRKFPVDMAGFAINLDFLFKRPKASMPYKPGFEEDGFLRSLSPFEPRDVELKADNCTKDASLVCLWCIVSIEYAIYLSEDLSLAHADKEKRTVGSGRPEQIRKHKHNSTETDIGLASGARSSAEEKQRSWQVEENVKKGDGAGSGRRRSYLLRNLKRQIKSL